MIRRIVVIILGILAVFVALAVAVVIWAMITFSEIGRPPADQPPPGTGERATGFTDTAGLRLVGALLWEPANYEWKLVWQGSGDDIDHALVSAGFNTPLKKGGYLTNPSLAAPSIDFDSLADLHSGKDEWMGPDGVKLHREVSRGVLPDGSQILVVKSVRENASPQWFR